MDCLPDAGSSFRRRHERRRRNGTRDGHNSTKLPPRHRRSLSPEEVVFLCDVPGLKHQDIEVSIEGGEKDQVWLGRSYGAFERSFTLRDLVDPEQMTADLADGVLTIRVQE